MKQPINPISRLAGAALLALPILAAGGSPLSAATLPYSVTLTPRTDLLDVYVFNDAYDTEGDGNYVLQKVADSAPAAVPVTARGTNAFAAPGAAATDFTAETAIVGLYVSASTVPSDPSTYGIAIAYNTAAATAILAAEPSGYDASFNGTSLPSYDPTAGPEHLSLDDDEPTFATALFDGNTDLITLFGEDIVFGGPGYIVSPNDLNDPSATFLDFSNASLGGSAVIAQTVQPDVVPEPAAAPIATASLVGVALLRSRRRRVAESA